MNSPVAEFDYVIVGAGPAGCVLANRLSAHPGTSVCLLEAGPSDRNIMLQVPAGVYSASSNSRFAWQFATEPSDGTAGRSIPMPQGRTLGGSTAINGMNYNRGAPEDFDDWSRAGNSGWSYADVLPYFKKTERRVGPGDARYRGFSGSLPITDSDWRHPVCDAFIQAAESRGVPRNPDYNGASQAGVGYYQRYIERGWRVSAASAFLRPARARKNLEVKTNSRVVSITLEKRRAVAVRFVHGRDPATREVRARREIILAAGAANTPKILQLSGIGGHEDLGPIGIPVLHHLPGVGKNLQDHYMIHLVAAIKGSQGISGHGLSLVREVAKWAVGMPSILAISPSLVYGFINTAGEGQRPDLQIDVALGNYSRLGGDRVPVLKAGFYQLRPESRGYVKARSADPSESPIIQPNYLLAENDRRAAVRGITAVRKILRAEPFGRFYQFEEMPGDAITSDADCLAFAREAGLTAYHLCGSCQMGARPDNGAVVDEKLRVHGVAGLRIADASIMPCVPSANTSAAVFMIGEKAADALAEPQRVPEVRLALAV